MRPRVGHIQYLNCLPIYYGLVRGMGVLDLDLVKGTPTELNGLLLSGKLDISPISSIEYARHHEDLLLLPGPVVSCRGPVQSILLISRVPIENLGGSRIALTASSATSHVLLKLLLEGHYGLKPEYFLFDDDMTDAFQMGDAALLIGDRALEHNVTTSDRFLYDLGEEWWKATSSGMVFAVWAVRREFAAEFPDRVSHVWKIFRDSIRYCMDSLHGIAVDAARWERYPASFLEEYFRALTFDFEDDLKDGLTLFYRKATECGHLGEVPSIEFFSHTPSASVDFTADFGASL